MSYNAAERLDIAHPADEEVRASLRLLLSRPEFNASARNRRFLTYIVEETLSGRASRIKAYGIALTVFQRADDFNPLIDPVVRIEAARATAERFGFDAMARQLVELYGKLHDD